MKMKALIAGVVVFSLTTVIVGGEGVFAYSQLRTPLALSGEGAIVLTPGPLLDDFRNAPAPVNVWGGSTDTFSSAGVEPPPDAICQTSYINNPSLVYGGTGYSLRLDYNVCAPSSYAGYYTGLGGASIAG